MNESDGLYRDFSEDQIDLVLGEAVLRGSFGSKPISESEKRALGSTWFLSNLSRWAEVICNDSGIANLMIGPQSKDRNLLFMSVLDLLLHFEHLSSVPVGALAAKVIHYGIDRLCSKSGYSKP